MATSVPRFLVPSDGFPRSIANLYRLVVFGVVVLLAGCVGEAPDKPLVQSAPVPTIAESNATQSDTTTAAGSDGADENADEATAAAADVPAVETQSRPDWLGTRVLPTIPGGVVVPQTTPEELKDRRFETVGALNTTTGGAYTSSVEPVPADVLARSTWSEGCPVQADELAYLTLTFWGFDGLVHLGEMIVHRDVADDIVAVFADLFESRFPIEQMTVVPAEALDAEPTGDGNNTTAFVCRPVTGGTSFSQHAYGLAIDVNPFHNPYIRNDLVLPELAGSYLDRDQRRAGMVVPGGPAVEAFEKIGWHWGGDWQSLKDYQHFSHNDR